jgi:acetate---CoA ligase (ADP-forming)
MTPKWFLPFFRPEAVVVVGVSNSPEKLGYGVARNLIASGYKGAIRFVSKKEGELFDRKVYKDLNQVPGPLDLAVLIVPNTAMAAAIESCGRRGIRAAILVSGGFGELGPEGKQREAECLAIARRYDMRLIGPNCIGILDTHLPLDTTFLQSPLPAAGGIALVSHSGAFCAAIVDWARQQSFGFSRLISLGNQIDVNETDVLAAVAEDDETRVIVMYLESVSDGTRFVEVARGVTAHKPVIALKAGRFESGQRAAASHTGAMAGSDTAFDAGFARGGVLRAETVEQVFDWARALQDCPLPEGKGVAVLTDAGGLGVIAADALETNELDLAELSGSSRAALSEILPAAASIHNPVDLLASASPETYSACLAVLLADPQVAMVMVIVVPPPLYASEAVAEAMVPIIQGAKKPAVVVLTGSELAAGAAKRFTEAGIVFYPFPERAASSLGVLARRAEAIREAEANPPDDSPAVRTGPCPRSAEALMEAYGIAHAQSRLVRGASTAGATAAELGFAVVMKVASTGISHKSDIGGVLLNIQDVAEAVAGFDLLMQRAKTARPEAPIDGVLIQHQVSGDHELIIGTVRDRLFGPMIMFGSGGTEAEGLRDVAFALCPLNAREAEQLIMRTWAGKRLAGFRNIPPANRAAVLEIVMKVSRLAHENPEIEEFEINPVLADASGALSVDARVKFSS